MPEHLVIMDAHRHLMQPTYESIFNNKIRKGQLKQLKNAFGWFLYIGTCILNYSRQENYFESLVGTCGQFSKQISLIID
jgi:hypothetical protein